jgi:hypothetical protein
MANIRIMPVRFLFFLPPVPSLTIQQKNQMALKMLFIWYIIHAQPFAAKIDKRQAA